MWTDQKPIEPVRFGSVRFFRFWTLVNTTALETISEQETHNHRTWSKNNRGKLIYAIKSYQVMTRNWTREDIYITKTNNKQLYSIEIATYTLTKESIYQSLETCIEHKTRNTNITTLNKTTRHGERIITPSVTTTKAKD